MNAPTGRHPRLTSPAATFDELAARGVYPGAAVHEQPDDDYPRAWPPGIDDDRAELNRVVERYSAEHPCSYAEAFRAVADEEHRF